MEGRTIASAGEQPFEGIDSSINSLAGEQPEVIESATNSPANEQSFEGIDSSSDSPACDQPQFVIESATNSPAGDRTDAATRPPRFVTGDQVRGIYQTAYGGTEQREGLVEVDPLGWLYVTLEKKAKFDVTPRVLLDSLQDVLPLPDPVVTRETTELIGQLTQQGNGLEAIRELIVGRYGVPDRRLMSTSQLRDLRDRLLSLLANQNQTKLDSLYQQPRGCCGSD